jgi:lipid-binding SYLF domain-containing protein
MKRVSSSVLYVFLFVVLVTGLAISQQPPPPPPPQPAASSPNTTGNQQSGAPADASQPSNQPQSPAQQNPTQPNVAPPPPQSETHKTTKVPQADQMAAERQQDLQIVREKADDRLRESRDVLKEALGVKSGIPKSLLEGAKCVIVVPAVKKAAFVFGAKYGRGVMTCRLGEDFKGTWSAPSMYAIEGGNFGLQIGIKGTDLVLLVMNEGGVNALLKSKVKLGGDLSVAAGPVGRTMEASTDLSMKAQMLSYSRAHGLFAGVAVDGSTLRPDDFANEALYHRQLKAREIVRSGDVPVPSDAAPLILLLQQTVHASSDGRSSPTAERK